MILIAIPYPSQTCSIEHDGGVLQGEFEKNDGYIDTTALNIYTNLIAIRKSK